MKALRVAALSLSLLGPVLGQQLVTTTDQVGNTIVEQVTTNAFGQPLTQVLQTLPPGTTPPVPVSPPAVPSSPSLSSPSSTLSSTLSTTSPAQTTPVATPNPDQQGPVGQPAPLPETPYGPTPFVYTTTDADGNPTTISAIFTPTFPATTPFTPTGTGTILAYSDWLKLIGNATANLAQPVSSHVALSVDGSQS
ncbi:hypothetical protein BC834DRAFT_592596 [Gloeopeniophorella convolvens]|nr:hypothetical protein BC834DRAFT_592596 [Gloeopeniophorella convolvens]